MMAPSIPIPNGFKKEIMFLISLESGSEPSYTSYVIGVPSSATQYMNPNILPLVPDLAFPECAYSVFLLSQSSFDPSHDAYPIFIFLSAHFFAHIVLNCLISFSFNLLKNADQKLSLYVRSENSSCSSILYSKCSLAFEWYDIKYMA